MVCSKCEKKLDKLATPDVWKTKGEEGMKKIGVNKLIERKNYKFDPFGPKCKFCKVSIPSSSQMCQKCAYSKGLCSMCGVKILDIKFYRQSDT